jgi:hypothetical protein
MSHVSINSSNSYIKTALDFEEESIIYSSGSGSKVLIFLQPEIMNLSSTWELFSLIVKSELFLIA